MMTMMTNKLRCAVPLLLAISGCENVIDLGGLLGPGGVLLTGEGEGEGGGTEGEGETGPGSLTTSDIFTRLSPTCVGCHGSVSDRPYFQDLTSFQNLIVTDPAFVVAGDPQRSRLLALLDGSDPQWMPPGAGNAFIDLERAGQTSITVDEVSQWIAALPVVVPDPPQDIPVLRRKNADMIINSLRTQLGLVDEDFYNTTYSPGVALYPLSDDRYTSRSPDAVPFIDPFGESGVTYTALGGAWHLEGKTRHTDITQTFLQTFTHMSQAWCRTAAEKGSGPLFARAAVADGTGTPESLQRVRDNIAVLHLNMLGEPATAADVDGLLAVFVAYEGFGTQSAWTGTCAALVRDPLWMTY
jgi:hypothetical protein